MATHTSHTAQTTEPESRVPRPTVRAVKASFNLPEDELDGLRDLAADRRVSVTQALRQSIATERFIADQLSKGAKVLIEQPDGTAREVVFRN